MAKKQAEPEPVAFVSETTVPTTYTVTLGVKYPSSYQQYKMIEAHVSVTSADYEEAHEHARLSLDQALMNQCDSWNEPYPAELQERLDAASGEGDGE